MSFYQLTLVYSDPNLTPSANSDVGRKIRNDGLQFHYYQEALSQASAYSKFNRSVNRVVVTHVTEDPVCTYRNGVKS